MARRKMTQKRMTQSEIGEMIGKDRSYVSKILNGTRPATLDMAGVIFKVAGIKIGPLVRASDQEARTVAKFAEAA